ncbi:MAG TPA: D-tyrosyl-tRNA(Tyr) deacylase [Candidatus Gallimonas gallistercoris]|uniref:D-aminoacyl-tRNA deacylase n=1 Tax=Candidatus Gallimonas gallistercoris TaxID=2838602 RepID=A0A9D2H1W4_9FIRM|nr:D-tyrosyl-tRNA(Tyr) deacylase [Candidatus Gallimonas gallistercoris]
MKFVAQRVASAALCVSGELVSEIGRGLVVYLGVKAGDNEKQAEKAMEKVALLRVFEDEAGKMNLSVRDVKGEVLLVSQFTLYGDSKKGNRPSFSEAERPERADALYEHAVSYLRSLGVPVQTGVFGADMQISQHNDGPVTIIFEC